MGRASTQIVIFLVLMTAASNAIMASGVGAALGVAPTTGAQSEIDQVQSDADEIEPAQGSSDTLFSLYNSVTGVFASIYGVIFAAPLMLVNIGMPTWLVTFIFAPAVVIVAADVAHLLTGRDP